jgi:GT2 family glycosyltransferase
VTILQVVSVNYFGADSLGVLADSLVRQSSPDWELAVVDNSESDSEVRKLAQLEVKERRVTLAVAPANLGYFGGAHWWLGQRTVTAEWVAVCNADVALADEDFVATLEALREPAAVVAPDVTALPGGYSQNPYLEERPSARRMLIRRLVLSTRPTWWAAWQISDARRRWGGSIARPGFARDIYAPHGSFILFRRAFFEQGGTLAHPPFLYGEEITVAECASRLGQSVRFEPALKVIHTEHQATGNVSKRAFFAMREASVYAHTLIRQSEKA